MSGLKLNNRYLSFNKRNMCENSLTYNFEISLQSIILIVQMFVIFLKKSPLTLPAISVYKHGYESR